MDRTDPLRPPRVTVVMPVYNAGDFVSEAVESVLAQTFDDLELIAVDDGSSDDSRAILERYARLDSRIRVVRNETNLGLVPTTNLGCRLSRSEYIARLDADDVALPDRLASQVEFLDSHPSVAAVGGAAISIDPSGRQISVLRLPSSSAAIRARMPKRCCFIHSSVTMRRDAFEAVGGYRFGPGGGYDLWLRLSERFDLANLPQPVVRYRVHAEQSSIVSIEELVRNVVAIQAAARARVATGRDPLDGVVRLTPAVRESVGCDSAEIDRALGIEWVRVACRLAQLGRLKEADEAVARASRTLGRRASRTFRAAQELTKAVVLFESGHRLAAAGHVLAAGRHEPRFTSSRVVAVIGERRYATPPVRWSRRPRTF